jgi:hypothetical protein
MREGSGAGVGCHCWYTRGGSVKCEAEATLDADEEVGAARGAVEGVAVTHGTGGGARAVRGTSWGAIEEG